MLGLLSRRLRCHWARCGGETAVSVLTKHLVTWVVSISSEVHTKHRRYAMQRCSAEGEGLQNPSIAAKELSRRYSVDDSVDGT